MSTKNRFPSRIFSIRNTSRWHKKMSGGQMNNVIGTNEVLIVHFIRLYFPIYETSPPGYVSICDNIRVVVCRCENGSQINIRVLWNPYLFYSILSISTHIRVLLNDYFTVQCSIFLWFITSLLEIFRWLFRIKKQRFQLQLAKLTVGRFCDSFQSHLIIKEISVFIYTLLFVDVSWLK